MTDEKVLKLAAKANMVSVINGKYDAFYVPPESIKLFAKLLTAELKAEQKRREARAK